jgi:O-antigen/teichoic acid export membrane protein
MSFFGEKYIIGASTLFILGLAQLINTAVGANGYLMNMCGYEKVLLINDIFMAVINIILNYIMIPKYSIVGAAIATAISIASFNLFKVFQVKYYLNIIPFNRKYFHIIINISIISLFTYFIKGVSNNIIIVFFNTGLSMLMSFIISYLFKDELDEFLFNKFKKKLKKIKIY